MSNINYLLIATLCLSIIVSCSDGSPSGTDDTMAMHRLVVGVDPGEAGTVSPASEEYEEGTSVEVTATPNDGWVFSEWTGDHTGITNPVSVKMDSDKDIAALFTERTYPLTVNIEGEGVVSERVVREKTTDYPEGTIVELTATPAGEWRFSHWEGDIDEAENPIEINIDEEKNVTAVFAFDTLVIEIIGKGSVTEEIVSENNRELTAIAEEDWEFSKWKSEDDWVFTDEGESGDNPILVSVLNETNITVIFLCKRENCDDSDDGDENGNDDNGDDNGNGDGDDESAAVQYFSEPDVNGDIHQTEELNFVVETVVTGLGTPWGMAFLPDGKVLITEREGDLRMVEDGELRSAPISGAPNVVAQGQGGLLDVKLHPDYENNGWIYFSFAKAGEGGAATSIVRAQLDGYQLVNHEEIYTGNLFSNSGSHFGSRIGFDGDGYLYFSIGDRGDMNTAQDITNSNGNLFRLNDDGSVPSDNPFVGEEGLDEIYAYGLRNIQGMATHPETGVIWTNLHGPRGGDEINVHDKPGANYGWPEITHGVNYDGSEVTPDTARAGMEQPVMHWTPSIAPSGMAFVVGDRYPEWTGDILNGALSFQLISRIVIDGDEYAHEERFVNDIGRIRAVEMAPDGYIYFSNESNGTINRIVPVD